MKPNDLYQQITEKILELMETNGTDWTRPWATQAGGTPHNVCTGASYRGIKVPLLGLAANQKGYDSPAWGSFRQWRLKGGRVRKGEKGTLGVFYKTKTILDEGDEERTVSVIRHFFLFNAAQVDGVEIATADPISEPERLAAAESFLSNTGAVILHGGDRAAYSPALDQIRVPNLSAFLDREAYYSTALHELSHWTGHWSRLDRRKGMESRFGDQQYACEELVAELASCFLCIALGVSHEPRQDHAQYLNNWMAVLKDDVRAFSSACSKAQEAADFLHGLQANVETAA